MNIVDKRKQTIDVVIPEIGEVFEYEEGGCIYIRIEDFPPFVEFSSNAPELIKADVIYIYNISQKRTGYIAKSELKNVTFLDHELVIK